MKDSDQLQQTTTGPFDNPPDATQRFEEVGSSRLAFM